MQVKRKLRIATFGLALALTLVAGALAQESSSRRAAAITPAGIPVTVIEDGKAIAVESLPPESQAQIGRLRSAAQSLAGPSETGAQRFKVTVNCTYPPLKCTITIEF
jgi:hypothetical protein